MTTYGRSRNPGKIDPLTFGSAYSLAVQSLSPIGYWPLDDPSGTSIAATVGSSGTYVNGPILGVGGPSSKIATGVQFDGSNDYGTINLDLSAISAVTFSFWLYWDAFVDNDKMAMEHTATWSTNRGILFDPNEASTHGFVCGMGTTGGTNYRFLTITRPSANAWHHYAFRLDRSAQTVTARVDGSTVSGTLMTSGTVSGNFVNSTLYLMSRAGTSFYGAGRLAHIAVFSTILSDADCSTLYQAGI